jgi:transcription initiation factor TFIIIB Brf1 subunit/transcription initiation factor TFIIB
MLQNRFQKILVLLVGSLNSIRGLNEAISLAKQSGFASGKNPVALAAIILYLACI